MKTSKLLKKYLLILLIYVVIVRFLRPYGLQLYYSIGIPEITEATVQTIQSIILAASFLLRIIVAIFIYVDARKKVAIDWFILVITIFYAEIGILAFLIWQIYKENR